MQPLTAPPREHLTAEQVFDLITGDELTVAAGLELLDSRNRFVEDISDDLVGGKVTHDGRDVIHGKCSLQIQRPLAWGRDRVRPYMTLSNAAVSARRRCRRRGRLVGDPARRLAGPVGARGDPVAS